MQENDNGGRRNYFQHVLKFQFFPNRKYKQPMLMVTGRDIIWWSALKARKCYQIEKGSLEHRKNDILSWGVAKLFRGGVDVLTVYVAIPKGVISTNSLRCLRTFVSKCCYISFDLLPPYLLPSFPSSHCSFSNRTILWDFPKDFFKNHNR